MATVVEIILGVRGDDVDPQEITEVLGVPFTHALAKGEPQKPHNALSRPAPWGVWQVSSIRYTQSNEVEDHAQVMLAVFEPIRNKLEFYINSSKHYVDIRIWWESDYPIASFGFDSTTIRRLSAICNEINFSIHPGFLWVQA